jgi:hypothetical protein
MPQRTPGALARHSIQHFFAESDSPNAPLIVEWHHNFLITRFADEILELDLRSLRSSNQVDICSIIQGVDIIPDSWVVLIGVSSLQVMDNSGIEELQYHRMFLKISWKKKGSCSLCTDDFIDDFPQDILHVVIQILRFILFKPLPSSLYDRLFVDCFSPSFSRMKKRDREYINQIPDDATFPQPRARGDYAQFTPTNGTS